MTALNYHDFHDEIARKLGAAEQIVLATSADDIVTSRLVCPLNDGLDIFFSTGRNSLKIEQITKNPNVALVLDGINIEAVAELLGHPSGHADFMSGYAKKYPRIIQTYESTPDDVLVVARPVRISFYKYTGVACKDILDVKEKKAYRLEL